MTNEKNIFSEENEAVAGWFKFEKVGDSISGAYLGESLKEAHGNFPPQIIYELNVDGQVTQVGFPEKKVFVHQRMKNTKVGQIVGFKFTEEYQTEANKKQGFAPSKTIKVFKPKDDNGDYTMDSSVTDNTFSNSNEEVEVDF